MVYEAVSGMKDVAKTMTMKISAIPERLAHPIYFFGEVAVKGRMENRIPETEMQKYKNGFSLMQKMVESTHDPREKAFLSSPNVLRLMLGFDSCATYNKDEAKVIYQALRKVDSLRQFFIVDRRLDDWHRITIINQEKALSILQSKSADLGISDDLIKNISIDRLEDLMLRLLNDKQNYDRNWGILSGYPNDIVKDYIQNHIATIVPTVKANSETYTYLEDTEEGTPLIDTDRTSYERSYLDDNLRLPTDPNHPPGLLVNGFGMTFFSPKPPSQETIELCQKLLEIDRRLGLRKYHQSVLKKVDTMLLIKKIEGMFKKRR